MRRLAIGLFVLVCLFALLSHVRAHDAQHAGMSGEWIGKLGLRDPVTKYSCCGNMDCAAVPIEGVVDRLAGVTVLQTGEVIEQQRVIRMATPDGGWWRCEFLSGQSYRDPSGGMRSHRKGDTRCLIGPGHGS